MIGLWAEQASGFLVATAVLAIATLGVPMVLVPLAWARWLRWPVPADGAGRNLSTYFGRCLGAVICVQGVVVLFTADDPDLQPLLFALLVGNVALMIAAHAWGAVRGIQPRSETVETLAWAVLLLLALLFLPV